GMLRPVNRFRWRDRCSPILRRPRRDHYGGRHYRKNHQDKCEPIWFRCHLFPSWQQTEVARGTLRAETGELYELLHTSLVCPKNVWACPRGRCPVGLTCFSRRK